MAATKVTPMEINSPYKFSAYQNAAMNIAASGVGTKIPCDVEDYDTGNNFASGTFTAPVAGFYLFSGKAHLGMTTADFCYLSIHKNGTEYHRGNFMVASASNSSGLLVSPPLMQLAAGDTIEMFGYQTSGAVKGVTTGRLHTYFGGHLVSTT